MAYISAMVTENRQSVIVWERDSNGNRDYRAFKAPYYFYYPNESGEFSDIHGKKLSKLTFNTYRDFYNSKEEFKKNQIKLYESDIGPEYKILSEHYYGKPSGKMNVTFLDIEVNYNKTIGFSSVRNPYAPISAISLYHQYNDTFVVYAVPPTPDWTEDRVWETMAADPIKHVYTPELREKVLMVLCKNEVELLHYFLVEIENSDILSGWNSTYFDMPYIYMRLLNEMGPAEAAKLSFSGARPPRLKEKEKFGKLENTVELFGRISLDYLELFIKLEQEKRASNTLEAISEELLPDMKKLEYEGPLHDLYHLNFPFFMRYNIRDTEILKGFDIKLKYIQFAVDFSHHATGLPHNILGTIKLTETAIINHCHYELNKIVPDSSGDGTGVHFPGGTVLKPQAGMHENVSGVDVKGLYPSTMRSLNISPECIVGQFVEKNRAYDAFIAETSAKLTLVYEDRVIEEKTPVEWKKIFKENKWSISGYGTVFTQQKRGFITDIITDWFNKRIEYQKELKNWRKILKELEADSLSTSEAKSEAQEKIDYYDKLQYVYKIRNNSIYGCVGNEFFKFFDVRMAESVTRTGGMILMHMVRTIGKIMDGEYVYPTPSALYGDTDSCYFPTHTENADSALTVAKEVCKQVNDSFKSFMQSSFLCNEEYDGLISCEQEIIARKAIFIGKKYYILHLINKNGKPMDEIKIMGHPVKKTTLPKPIRQKLIPYIEMLMKGVEWNVIGKELVYYKDELKNTKNVWDLGAPIGTSSLGKYLDLYQHDPTTFLPGACAASIFYNQCVEKYGDLGSPLITPGTKVKVFKLKKEFGRFKTIAVPSDTRVLPNWFLQDFAHLVDREAQVYKLIDMTMANIIEAIGKRMPTKKSLLVDEVVEY